MQQLQKSLAGTNIYAVAILLAASIFGGMSGELAGQIAGVISGIVGLFIGFRNWFKNAKLATGKSWIGDPNNWAYLTAVVAAAFPKFADLVPALHDLATAIASGNWGSIITAGVSILTLVYYLVIKGKVKPTANVIIFMLAVPALAGAGCTDPNKQQVSIQAPVQYDAQAEQAKQVPETHICKTIETRAGNIRRAVGSFGKYWTGKQPTVTVRILAKNATREAYFKQAANDWSSFCGLKFQYITTGKADIRVRFDDGEGSWSYVGTDARNISGTTSATLNVGWDGYDVAAHEIGHAIGLQHEQSNPQKGICWNEAVVIKALSGPPNYWSKEQIKFNVFDKADPATVNATDWDAVSIMQYNIPGPWVCDGKAISGGKVISERDRQFIASAYPGGATGTGGVTITSEQRQRLLNAADEIKTVLQ